MRRVSVTLHLSDDEYETLRAVRFLNTEPHYSASVRRFVSERLARELADPIVARCSALQRRPRLPRRGGDRTLSEILSIGTWRTNAEMIADVALLPGYLVAPIESGETWTVLDATYGEGKFWTHHQPEFLNTNDLYKPADNAWDYRALLVEDGFFDVVVFDPPYKLNGTPALPDMDARYGTNRRTTRDEVLEDIRLGTIECYRVCRRRLFVKCMDQVEGGRKRWQTDLVTDTVNGLGGRKIDRFDIPTAGIPQAATGRVQRTSRAKHSTLLVFEKPRSR